MESKSMTLGWESLPPELLRKVVQHLLGDWYYEAPDKRNDSMLPIRGTCRSWRSVVDADIKQIAVTVPSVVPGYLAKNFPNVTSLELSRYQRSCQEVFPVLQHMNIRSLVLADPWDPPLLIPTQYMAQLTHLSFLAENLIESRAVARFCHTLSQLQQLQVLQLNRLQLLQQAAAQQLGLTFAVLPHLSALSLSGGANPVSPSELHWLLNVDLPGLRSLELTCLNVRALPVSLTRLVGLTRLAFTGEMVRTVQMRTELGHLTNLQVLDISANLAEHLPAGIMELTGLRELHAGMNRLGVHLHNFRQLYGLEVLVLASNKLPSLPSSMWGLYNLKRLDLGHNNLTELPQDVSQLTRLTFLNVCHNFLAQLPYGLSCLTDLIELDVSLNTDMRELPTGLGSLAHLSRLTASHMRLKNLPCDVGGLVSLVHLDVSHNSLHHLSPQLSALVRLTHLEAGDNKLHQGTAVPEELAALTALRVLRLARNRLQSLPEALGCYSRLQVLDCSGNRLTSVPRVVGKCTALQQLHMASNRLRGLTSGIGNLVRLQVLDLSHNQYRHLPTMTGDLTQLQALLLDDNQLEDLPTSCSALSKLTRLTLSNNRLHVLPDCIRRMSALITLTLRNNPLLGRDSVVLQLQRQLGGLSIDELPRLQSGSGKPVKQLTELSAQQLVQGFLQAQQGWAEPTASAAIPVPVAARAGPAAAAAARPPVPAHTLLQQGIAPRNMAELLHHLEQQRQQTPANADVVLEGIANAFRVGHPAAASHLGAIAGAAGAAEAPVAGWVPYSKDTVVVADGAVGAAVAAVSGPAVSPVPPAWAAASYIPYAAGPSAAVAAPGPVPAAVPAAAAASVSGVTGWVPWQQSRPWKATLGRPGEWPAGWPQALAGPSHAANNVVQTLEQQQQLQLQQQQQQNPPELLHFYDSRGVLHRPQNTWIPGQQLALGSGQPGAIGTATNFGAAAESVVQPASSSSCCADANIPSSKAVHLAPQALGGLRASPSVPAGSGQHGAIGQPALTGPNASLFSQAVQAQHPAQQQYSSRQRHFEQQQQQLSNLVYSSSSGTLQATAPELLARPTPVCPAGSQPNGIASAAAASGGGAAASLVCGDQDDASSAEGLESCGSDDSSSDVVQLSNSNQNCQHSNQGRQADTSSAAQASAGACGLMSDSGSSAAVPAQCSEELQQPGAVVVVNTIGHLSRCPSSTSTSAAGGPEADAGSTSGTEAAAIVTVVRDKDGCVCCSKVGDHCMHGCQPGEHSVRADMGCKCQGGEGSFTHVLEAAWWGGDARRR